jgi:hypothetical protein
MPQQAAPALWGGAAGAALLCLLSLPAGAAELPVAALSAPLPVGSLLQRALPERLAVNAWPGGALNEQHLDSLRGGSDRPWSDMKLNGAVSDNSATSVVTGANIISDGAFSNASGLPMVIQNSGANVLIQNATIVNVQIQ